MPMDLTTAAQEGYARANSGVVTCPYIWSSPCWEAFHVGRFLAHDGAPMPRRAAASRGSSVRINGTRVYRVRDNGADNPAISEVL